MHYCICMGKCYKMAICCLFYLLKSLEVFDVFIVTKLLRCFPSYFPLFKHNVENQFPQVYGKQTNGNAAAGIKSGIGEVAEAEEG